MRNDRGLRSLVDESLELDVRMEAFTPFVPLDADASGIPAAVIRYRCRNTGSAAREVSVVGSLPNVCGMRGFGLFGNVDLPRPVRNELRRDGGATGLFYAPESIDPDALEYATMALLTTEADPTWRAEWLPAHWVDHIQDFWDDFAADGALEPESRHDAPMGALQKPGNLKVGSVGGCARIEPGDEHVFEFVLAWHVPNRPGGWTEEEARQAAQAAAADRAAAPIATVRNYYATKFDDAWSAARHLLGNLESLETRTDAFHDALFGSSLPPEIIDAAASNITVLRSPTCYRLEDGSFLGWEGCFDGAGCCEGSCTHVWNYAQTVAFLFPELERSMRRIEFGMETDESGSMAFRARSIYGLPRWEMLPATDGQLGTIVRLYREWKLSGDDEFLRELWPKAALALDFAFEYWDRDDDCVLDSQQHNTYDIEFFGPNSLSNSFFYAALAAGEEIAVHLGESERADRYRTARREGSARMDELLWNGEYYEQRIDDVDEYRYQYGTGCLSDQLMGQYLAHVAGIGHVLPEEHVRSAMRAIVEHNFLPDVGVVPSVQRTYALPGESGLMLCTWPRGGRPRLPFVYSDEVWTGIEYQVAATCVWEGLVDEAVQLVRAARERHDGYRRNPWNEVECGHHYARSMASWALIPALSGFRCDLAAGTVEFDPPEAVAAATAAPSTVAREFRCFFSTGRSWGVYRQTTSADGDVDRSLEVRGGEAVPGW
ncbi:MAG: GH116 family glycosyl hydrolase [Spirochaetota bacterium]